MFRRESTAFISYIHRQEIAIFIFTSQLPRASDWENTTFLHIALSITCHFTIISFRRIPLTSHMKVAGKYGLILCRMDLMS